jgi:hypothetical protein
MLATVGVAMVASQQVDQEIRQEPALDQDGFWLKQPKIINLIAFKVIEQLYGFT